MLGPDGATIIAKCQAEAEARGEVAMPVSARTEVLLQAKQVSSTSDFGGKLNKKSLMENGDFETTLSTVLGQWGSTGVNEVGIQ